MSPWTVRYYQGCLVIERGQQVYRIPTGLIIGIKVIPGAWIAGGHLDSRLEIVLPERDLRVASSDHEGILELRGLILDAIQPYWGTGAFGTPVATVTALHGVDR